MTPLEQQYQAFMQQICGAVLFVLSKEWHDKQALDQELEDHRIAAEQATRAVKDPLNKWGTGVEYGTDPEFDPEGACRCLQHFIHTAGAKFREELETGVV